MFRFFTGIMRQIFQEFYPYSYTQDKSFEKKIRQISTEAQGFSLLTLSWQSQSDLTVRLEATCGGGVWLPTPQAALAEERTNEQVQSFIFLNPTQAERGVRKPGFPAGRSRLETSPRLPGILIHPVTAKSQRPCSSPPSVASNSLSASLPLLTSHPPVPGEHI